LYFIHKHDNLMELVFNLKEAGYEPKIKWVWSHNMDISNIK
jgi:hypothetical protein